MGNKKLLDKRVLEFPNQGLIKKGETLFCTLRSTTVDHLKASVVKNHIKSITHERRKQASEQQPSLKETLESNVQKKTVWSAMVSAFVAAGAPLHIFAKPSVRSWITGNVKQGHSLPSETTLRRYLLDEGKGDLDKTVSLCAGKDVMLIVDETQDLLNRKVANLLVAPAELKTCFRLLHTEILKTCNAQNIIQLIINGLHIGKIPINNVIAIVSDNAKYMISAGKLFQGMNSRTIHTTCWAHVLHLVSEEIRNSLELADTLIAKVKACLVKAPTRRAELLDVLQECGAEQKLPPTPVITRWTTWLETGGYHFRNFEAIKKWIIQTPPDSESVKKRKVLIVDTKLYNELETISVIYESLSCAIKILEGNNPSSDVMFQLELIRGFLESYPSLEPGLVKLLEYLTTKHPCVDFWNDVQYFDPRKQWKFNENTDIPDSLKRFSLCPIPRVEILTYKNICIDFVAEKDFTPFSFWTNFSRELPELSHLATKLLVIPASSAEVERSFSHLNRIMTPMRSSLTEENLGIHLRIQFNNREHGQDSEAELKMCDDE